MSDSIRDKIRKLLALSEGNANEAESQQAMAMAASLMMRHGIEQDSLRTSEQKAKIVRSEQHPYDHDWQMLCVQAAGVLYSVMPLIHRDWQKNLSFSFTGRQDNVDAAQDTTAFILLQVDQLYRAALPKGLSQKERAQYRKDFKKICASRVYGRCCDVVANPVEPTAGALVIYQHREQLMNEITVFNEGLNIRQKQSRPMTVKSTQALLDGRIAGDKVDLHRKVS